MKATNTMRSILFNFWQEYNSEVPIVIGNKGDSDGRLKPRNLTKLGRFAIDDTKAGSLKANSKRYDISKVQMGAPEMSSSPKTVELKNSQHAEFPELYLNGGRSTTEFRKRQKLMKRNQPYTRSNSSQQIAPMSVTESIDITHNLIPLPPSTEALEASMDRDWLGHSALFSRASTVLDQSTKASLYFPETGSDNANNLSKPVGFPDLFAGQSQQQHTSILSHQPHRILPRNRRNLKIATHLGSRKNQDLRNAFGLPSKQNSEGSMQLDNVNAVDHSSNNKMGISSTATTLSRLKTQVSNCLRKIVFEFHISVSGYSKNKDIEKNPGHRMIDRHFATSLIDTGLFISLIMIFVAIVIKA